MDSSENRHGGERGPNFGVLGTQTLSLRGPVFLSGGVRATPGVSGERFGEERFAAQFEANMKSMKAPDQLLGFSHFPRWNLQSVELVDAKMKPLLEQPQGA